MGLLETLNEEHKARRERLRKAALKAVTKPEIIIAIEIKPEEEPQPQPSIERKVFFTNTFDATVYEVCRYYNVREKDIFSHRHMPEVVKSRYMIIYVMYELTSLTNPQIGAKMGRDPTSIWYAIKKVKANISKWRPDIDILEKLIEDHMSNRKAMFAK